MDPIRTQVDYELEGVPRGAELDGAVAQRALVSNRMAQPATYDGSEQPVGAGAMTWGDFQQRHPDWDGPYWAECRALYGGGKRLFGDQKVFEALFPKHLYEAPQVYKQRKDRAHYFAYAGSIIDHLLAGLGTDPLTISFAEVDDKGKATAPPGTEWWSNWVLDVTDEGESGGADEKKESADDEADEGGRSMHTFLVDVLRESLQTQTAWVLADLPRSGDGVSPPTGDDKDDPYLCIVPAEQVIDWEEDDRGQLTWAIVMTTKLMRPTPRDKRGKLHFTYVLWDAETWTRYDIDVDPAKPPQDGTVIAPSAEGAHGFGRVPLERLKLADGMYAMGKMHSLAREHFNKRCAMSWAEYKSLHSVLYEYLAPEENNEYAVAHAQQDPSRAVSQVRGQGYTQVRGKEDRAEYVGPPVDAFTAARESCNDIMREMHRVMFSMSLSANMDSGALKRSGESKQQDKSTTEVLLDAFGVLMMRFCHRLLMLAGLGRNEPVPKATITGLQSFDVEGTADAISEAVTLLNGVPILSPTFKEIYLARLYGRAIGDVTQEQMEKFRDEIRKGISAEEEIRQAGMQATAAGMVNGGPEPKPGDPASAAPPKPAAGPPKKQPPRGAKR